MLRAGFDIQAVDIRKARGYDINRRKIAQESTVHLGRYISDMPLDIPDTLATSPAMAEEGYVVGVCLGIVSTDDTEQC